jgi:hypothetical protein
MRTDDRSRKNMNFRWRKELIPDALNLLLGAGLFMSPWAFGFVDEPRPTWNAWLSGLAIIALATSALATFADWEEWTALAVGVWVAMSPWILHFSGHEAATPLHVVVGILVAAIASLRIWYQDYPHVTA